FVPMIDGVPASGSAGATDIGYVPEGLDGNITTLTGSSGVLADGSWVAYRVVYGIRDHNNRTFLGAPGGRWIANNTSGSTGYSGGVTANITNRITIPADESYTLSGTTVSGNENITVSGSYDNIAKGHRI